MITGKLGGSETSLTTYTILSNMAAAIIIPLVFPMVENHTETSFICQFLTILRRVFPLLIFPFLIAWGLRVFFPKAHAAVVRHTGGLAFYLWGFGLTLSVGQTCRYLVDSPVSTHLKWLLSLVSLVACAMQFFIGKTVGAAYGERIGGGQGLGTKKHYLRHLGIIHLPVAGLVCCSRYVHHLAKPLQLVAAMEQGESKWQET